jgi:hypothetical protein
VFVPVLPVASFYRNNMPRKSGRVRMVRTSLFAVKVIPGNPSAWLCAIRLVRSTQFARTSHQSLPRGHHRLPWRPKGSKHETEDAGSLCPNTNCRGRREMLVLVGHTHTFLCIVY